MRRCVRSRLACSHTPAVLTKTLPAAAGPRFCQRCEHKLGGCAGQAPAGGLAPALHHAPHTAHRPAPLTAPGEQASAAALPPGRPTPAGWCWTRLRRLRRASGRRRVPRRVGGSSRLTAAAGRPRAPPAARAESMQRSVDGRARARAARVERPPQALRAGRRRATAPLGRRLARRRSATACREGWRACGHGRAARAEARRAVVRGSCPH